MFYYVYVLLSKKDKKFYTGYTENFKLRFEEHQKGRIISTKNRRPFVLVYSEVCLDHIDAMHREKYLKTHLAKCFLKKASQILFNRVQESAMTQPFGGFVITE